MKDFIKFIGLFAAISGLCIWGTVSSPKKSAAKEPAKNSAPSEAASFSCTAETTDETARCLNCHAERQPKLIESWRASVHAANKVGCYECHKGREDDPGAVPGHFGFCISTAVTPPACGECHEAQYAQFASSSHALAFDIIASASERIAAPDYFNASCASCHGSKVNMERRRPADTSWPNHGIGRINTDGSRGTCSACHSPHEDSLAKVRSAETCGRCHNVSFAPAMDAWLTSKHGPCLTLGEKNENYGKTEFRPLNESVKRPDCFICHMASADRTGESTHNISSRLSWKLGRLKAEHRENWGHKRLEMEKNCMNCHSGTQIQQFYRRLDALTVYTNKISERHKLNDSETDTDRLKNQIIKNRISAAMQSFSAASESLK